MARWKVTPNYKKSVRDIQYWTKGEDEIEYETIWRWGEFFVTTQDDNPPNIDPDGGFDIMHAEDYDLEDFSTDDGVADNLSYDCSDEVQAWVEEFLEENSIYDLEEHGWVVSDAEMWIDCEVTIEKCED